MNVLCINPDLSARMRFKLVALSACCFSSVHIAGSLGEGLERARCRTDIDAIYISRLFERETVREFVNTSKNLRAGNSAAHLLVVNEGRADRAEVASFALLGVDGFLLEPYSAQTLQTTARLATKLRSKTNAQRVSVGIDLLIPKIIQELDRSAKPDKGIPKATKALRELGNTLQSIPEELRDQYFERLIGAFEAVPAPASIDQTEEPAGTQGVSVTKRRITVRHL